MAVKLRLMRMGKKKQPVYRVVAADSRSPRDGRFIEILGTYEPRAEPSRVVINNDRAVRWLRERGPADRHRDPAPDPVRGDRGVQVRRATRTAPAVSSLDDGSPAGLDEEWDDHSQVDGGRAKAVLLFLARQLVDDPEGISIDTSETRHGIKLSLRVGPDDMGKVIGRRGRVAQSIRSVVRAAGAKDGIDVVVDIVD